MEFGTASSSFGILVLLLALSGCANDGYRYVAEVGKRGTVHIVEDGQRKQLQRARVRFTSGMGYWREYLTETVPAREDEPAVRSLIRDTPPERRPTNLMRITHAVGYHAPGYTWHGRLHWIIGSDPPVIAIGGNQGREAADRAHERRSEYPLVGSVDLGEQVTQLLILRGGRQLLWANRGDKAPRDVVVLPRPMSLDEVLTMRASSAPAAAGEDPWERRRRSREKGVIRRISEPDPLSI